MLCCCLRRRVVSVSICKEENEGEEEGEEEGEQEGADSESVMVLSVQSIDAFC